MSAAQVRGVQRASARSRRLRFLLGALAILIVGGLWAGLTKDPPRGREVFNDVVAFDGPRPVPIAQPAMAAPMPLPPVAEIFMGELALAPGESHSVVSFLGEVLLFEVPMSAGQELTVTTAGGGPQPAIGLELAIAAPGTRVSNILNEPDGVVEVSYVADTDTVVTVSTGAFGPPIEYEAFIMLSEAAE